MISLPQWHKSQTCGDFVSGYFQQKLLHKNFKILKRVQNDKIFWFALSTPTGGRSKFPSPRGRVRVGVDNNIK